MSAKKSRGGHQKPQQPQAKAARDSRPTAPITSVVPGPIVEPNRPDQGDRFKSLPSMSPYEDSRSVELEKPVAEINRNMAVNFVWTMRLSVLGIAATIALSAFYVGQRITQAEDSIKLLDKSIADLGSDLKEIRKEYGSLLKDERGQSTKIQDSLDRIEKTLAQSSAAQRKAQ